MTARIESRPGPVKNRTTVERKSDREVVVTRTVNGPARMVFEHVAVEHPVSPLTVITVLNKLVDKRILDRRPGDVRTSSPG